MAYPFSRRVIPEGRENSTLLPSYWDWTDWKDSLWKTWNLIQSLLPGRPVAFRPPYGQRTVELVTEQERLAHAPVMLWNIDSQDWNPKMPTERVADRVQKLMLLWRRGIVLFHDVHPKARVAIPHLASFAHAGGLSWAGCSAQP